jgi:DNA-binding transcriptional regulator GbsR (MarR family)
MNNEPMNTNDEALDEGDETTLSDDYASLYNEAESTLERLTVLSREYRKLKNDALAMVFEELVSVMALVKDHVGLSAEAYETVSQEESRLSDADAERNYALLRECRKVIGEMIPVVANSDAQARFKGLVDLITQQMDWTLSVSDWEPDEDEGGDEQAQA